MEDKYILSSIDTVLEFDWDEKSVKHVKISESNIKNCIFIRSSFGFYNFCIFSKEGDLFYINPKNKGLFSAFDSTKVEIEKSSYNKNSYSIKIEDKYMSSFFDGSIGFMGHEFQLECFWLFNKEDFLSIKDLLSHEWVSKSFGKKICKPSIKILEYKLNIFGIDICIYDFLQSCRKHKNGNNIAIIYENWKILNIFKYNPIFVYCLFGYGILKQFTQSVRSLVKHGKFNHRIFVITNLREEYFDNIRSIADITIERVDAFDRVDHVCSRLNITNYKSLYDNQPIIYSDADVIYDSDVYNFLYKMVFQKKISAQLEAGLASLRESDGVGAVLFKKSETNPLKEWGFNAGVLGIPNLYECGKHIELIKSSMMNYLRENGRDSLEFNDQAMSNYVLDSLDEFDEETITSVTHVPLDKSIPKTRKGIVHCWPCGEERHLYMEKYNDYLDASEE